MKTKFANRELVHIFASQSQEEGRGSNMSFRGPVLYSYSTAIMRIGNHKGKPYLLVNSTGYSVTTAKHMSYARRAVHHIEPQFSIHDQRMGTELDLSPKDIVDHYRLLAEEKAKETHKQKRMMYAILSDAMGLYETAMNAADFFGMGWKKMSVARRKLDLERQKYKEAYDKFEAGADDRMVKREQAARRRQAAWDARQAQYYKDEVLKFIKDPLSGDSPPYHGHVLPEFQEDYEKACRIREDWLLEQNKEKLEAWMRGDLEFTYGLSDMPVRLRAIIKGVDTMVNQWVETSHGAVIPYEDGKRCFKFAMRMNDRGWKRNGEQFQVGHYQLDAINEFGIIAGCHRIAWDEILRFAKQEGWILPSTESKHELSTTAGGGG